jgi:hypothetical protein
MRSYEAVIRHEDRDERRGWFHARVRNSVRLLERLFEVPSPMNWKRMLAYVTGSIDEELVARNEYLVTENRILRHQIKGRIRLTDPERISLAEAAKRLGRQALEEVAQIVRPETILGWHRRLIAKKFDGSKESATKEGRIDEHRDPRIGFAVG